MLIDVIPIVIALNLIFQKDSLNIAMIKPAVERTISQLEFLKDNDGHYAKEFKSLLADGGGKTLLGYGLEKTFHSRSKYQGQQSIR